MILVLKIPISSSWADVNREAPRHLDMSAGDLATANVVAWKPSVGVHSQEPGEVNREARWADRQPNSVHDSDPGTQLELAIRSTSEDESLELRRPYLGSMLHKCRQSRVWCLETDEREKYGCHCGSFLLDQPKVPIRLQSSHSQ